MSSGRAQLVLNGPDDRERARRWVNQAKPGTRVEFKGAQRTVEQNDRMWAMLTDVSRQHLIGGRKYTPDDFKVMFLTAYGEEVGLEIRHLPAIHRTGMIPAGRSSSDLSVKEMSELIEWIFMWGAENGIVWSDPKEKALLAAAEAAA
jgi:hypothetical protein